ARGADRPRLRRLRRGRARRWGGPRLPRRLVQRVVIDDPGLAISTDARRRRRMRAQPPRPVTSATDSTDSDTSVCAGGSGTRGDERATRAGAIRRRRRRRLAVLAVVGVVLVPILSSYVSALTGPGNDRVSERSVEWMRDHHLGGIVDTVERH